MSGIKRMATESQAKRESAFDKVDEQEVKQAAKSSERATQTPRKIKRFKTKLSDYSAHPIKKTTIEMPEDLLYAWGVYCTLHQVTKREHFVELLTKDLNKKMEFDQED